MKIKLMNFGQISIKGERYDHDIVIEKGSVRKHQKTPSQTFRGRFGHTPLSTHEKIPWHGNKLYIGTGFYGGLPIVPKVYEAANKKGVEVIAKPTEEICKIVANCKPSDISAILHVTC